MHFKERFTLKQRKHESTKVLRKYPDRIPVIVDVNSTGLVLDKSKYLVPNDLTMGQFMYVIRKRMKLAPEEGVYLFINNTLVSTSSLIQDVYAKHKDEDLFVYFVVSKENTFG